MVELISGGTNTIETTIASLQHKQYTNKAGEDPSYISSQERSELR